MAKVVAMKSKKGAKDACIYEQAAMKAAET